MPTGGLFRRGELAAGLRSATYIISASEAGAVAVAVAVARSKSERAPANPEGAAHGWAAFSDRGGMPSRKIPAHYKPRASDVSGRRFSLVPFLLASTKRNELGRVSGRKRLILLLLLSAQECIKQHQTLPLALRRAGSFLLLAQKKQNQRKGPAPTELTRRVTCSGIFRLAILARSKNGGHPCPPPSGSGHSRKASGFKKARANSISTQTCACNLRRLPHPLLA